MGTVPMACFFTNSPVGQKGHSNRPRFCGDSLLCLWENGWVPELEPMTADDEAAVAAQLGRAPRGVAGVAWRCPCGRPGVLATRPRLPDGTPFPTFYYLTCPRAVAACSTLESNGVMADMNQRLAYEPALAAAYEAAHEAYLRDRGAFGNVPQLESVSAGGMPTRVKCLHALVAHALAAGPGVNPFGDEAVAAIGAFWSRPCLENTDSIAPATTGTVRMAQNTNATIPANQAIGTVPMPSNTQTSIPLPEGESHV